jgi:hypothetical protein
MNLLLVCLFSIAAVKMGLNGNDFATVTFALAALASLYMYNIDMEKLREHKSRNEVIKALGECGGIMELYNDWKEKQNEEA